MRVLSRAGPRAVALETTLLVHGVPREGARALADDLARAVRDGGGEAGVEPAFVGIHRGTPVVGLTREEIDDLLGEDDASKVNAANLGLAIHNRAHGATTVSATLELAAAAGVSVFATGGLGGVHPGFGERVDVSADLAALARFPVCVVCAGVKSLLDVASTRELLESLGIPVIGFGTDDFPAFYVRESGEPVDARFDDAGEMARFVRAELARTGRAVVVARPVAEADAIEAERFEGWLREAEGIARASGLTGRAVTPGVLEALHRVSDGATLRANLSLARANARLGGEIRSQMDR